MSEKSGDKKWLVKNNNQIIGPFDEFELGEEFKNGNISLFATGCVPGQEFWSFLIAFPEFSHLADKTQLTQLTKTFGTSSLKTLSLYPASGTHTKTVTDPKASDSNFAVQELPYNVVEDAGKPDSLENIKKKQQSLIIWISALAVVIGLTAAVFYKKQKAFNDSSATSSLSDTGRIYFSTGFYSKALQVWNDAELNNQLDKDAKARMQLVRFQLNNDISQAEAVMHLNKPPEEIDELRKMMKALVQVKTGNFKMAQESLNELIHAQQLPSVKAAALANLALLSVRRGDCRFFDKHKKKGFTNKYLFHFAFSFCLLQTPSVSADQLGQAETSLQIILTEKGSYYQEALVGLAYIQWQKGKDVSSLMEDILDRSPYVTDNYNYDIFIDRNIYFWPQMLPLCEKIYSQQKDGKFFITFYAYCLTRSKHHNDARKFIERAVAIDSANVLIKSIHAYITETINLKDQSALILGDAIRSNSDRNYMLPYILQARFCEFKKDWECAIENWLLVLKNRPNSLSSFGGLSYAKYHQGYYAEAHVYVERGFKIDTLNLYSPLQFVKKMLEEN